MKKLAAKNTMAATNRAGQRALAGDDTGDGADDRQPTAISAARVVFSMRGPIQPSSAGTSVSEPRIIISTPIAEAIATRGDEGQAHQREAEERDDDGDAGEQHGAATGVDGRGDRVLDVEPSLRPSR
jgi:hypothetical protein